MSTALPKHSAGLPGDLKVTTTLARFQGLISDRYQLRVALEVMRDDLLSAPQGNAVKVALQRIDRALGLAEAEDYNQRAGDPA